jgi:hypothetical protein
MLTFVVDKDKILGIWVFKRIGRHHAFPFVSAYG